MREKRARDEQETSGREEWLESKRRILPGNNLSGENVMQQELGAVLNHSLPEHIVSDLFPCQKSSARTPFQYYLACKAKQKSCYHSTI